MSIIRSNQVYLARFGAFQEISPRREILGDSGSLSKSYEASGLSVLDLPGRDLLEASFWALDDGIFILS